MSEIKAQIEKKMTVFMESNPANYLDDGIKIYDPPLLGFAGADDKLFARFRAEENIIGSIFAPPEKWLPTAQTVISFFLPFSREIRQSNYPQGKPSLLWLHARVKGGGFIDIMRQWLIDEMTKTGGNAVSPLLNREFADIDFTSLRSSWSERHVAFAAGLGTFSHGKSLITKKGVAGRLGSIITDIRFEPTLREYEEHDSFCLLSKGIKCNKCIKRCPSGAISDKGKDRSACHHYLFKVVPLKEDMEKHNYPLYGVCGKCQTNVPCEDGIPG